MRNRRREHDLAPSATADEDPFFFLAKPLFLSTYTVSAVARDVVEALPGTTDRSNSSVSVRATNGP